LFVANHFIAEGVPKTTIYRIINKIESKGELKRKKGSGRIAVKMPKSKIKKLKEYIKKKGVNNCKTAKKYNISRQYVQKILAKNEIQNKKCQKAPLVTPQQKIKQKKRLNKLARNLMRPTNGCAVILDDECYFSLSGHNLASNCRYYCQRGEKVSPDIQFTKKSKFPQRYLLWLAISAKGISKPFFLREIVRLILKSILRMHKEAIVAIY
jgi:hypothetical protein